MTMHAGASRNFRQRGFSLVELMIAMTIGLLITAMLAVLFMNVSKANKEQFQAAEQQENGRYAMEILTNDLRTAGYYGEFGLLPPAGGALADPCAIPSQADIVASTANSPLAFYVQGYPAASDTASASIPAACSTWIDSATLKPGSDILVVRRLATARLIDSDASPAVLSALAIKGEVYAQTSPDQISIQYGDGTTVVDGQTGTVIDGTKNAEGVATLLTRKDFSQAVPPAGTRPTTAAYIRKLVVHVYFVAKCRQGSGSNGKCTSADDTIPTLTRLELGADADNDPSMKLVPLVEGIEFMKINYGLDTGSVISGKTVDGGVDTMVAAPAAVADWQNVVMAEIRLIARNTNSTSNYVDTKRYDLGNGITFSPSGNAATFKRHSFVSRAYIENIGGRREFSP